MSPSPMSVPPNSSGEPDNLNGPTVNSRGNTRAKLNYNQQLKFVPGSKLRQYLTKSRPAVEGFANNKTTLMEVFFHF